jgi:hypothetical protein
MFQTLSVWEQKNNRNDIHGDIMKGMSVGNIFASKLSSHWLSKALKILVVKCSLLREDHNLQRYLDLRGIKLR